MNDQVPKITVYKDENMPMARPKPIRPAETAQIRRICRYEYGDDLSKEDLRPEPEREEVARGYFSRDYQASVIAKQEGSYMREDSGVAGLKVSAPVPQNPYTPAQYLYSTNGAYQAPYGQQQQQQQQQYQPYRPQYEQPQPSPQYQHPAYAQVAGSPTTVRSLAIYSWTKSDWQRITGRRRQTQAAKKQVKE